MSEKFWIAFGDVHENTSIIHKIKDIREASGVLVSGDLTNVGGMARAAAIIDEIKALNRNVFAQIGNMDTRDVERYLDESGVNVHNRLISLLDDVYLLGLGYSTPTPFSTPSEVDETQVKHWLDGIQDKAAEAPHLIFMTHTPPYGTTTDRLSSGVSAGSTAVRDFIEKVQPGVCITGHIHEARSVDHVGKTRVVNPGILARGGYVRISFDGRSLDAELRQIK